MTIGCMVIGISVFIFSICTAKASTSFSFLFGALIYQERMLDSLKERLTTLEDTKFPFNEDGMLFRT